MTLNYFHNDIDEFNKHSLDKSLKKLRFCQRNIRGMNDLNKFDNILQLIDHVIVIGETWIKLEITHSLKFGDIILYFHVEMAPMVDWQCTLRIIFRIESLKTCQMMDCTTFTLNSI